MNFMVYAICGLLIAALVIKIFLKKYNSNQKDPFDDLRDETEISETGIEQEDKSEIDLQDFDKEYFERVQNGEPYQLFIKFASMNDCVFLQGLLSSDKIPSHVEHQHMNSLFGAGANMLSATFPAQLWILTSDYERACEIAVSFIMQKSETLDNSKDTAVKESVKKVLGVLTAPYPITKSQQILGINIFPKQQ